MTRRLPLGGKGNAPAPRFDNNIESYASAPDGRSETDRIVWHAIDRVVPSPFQVRRVFAQKQIEELADSILDVGLIHPPKGRRLEAEPGVVELLPGEMRFRAMRHLIDRGEDVAEKVLRKGPDGAWLMPIQLVAASDEQAAETVMAENRFRTDLSDWEWALAWRDRREQVARWGQAHTITDLAGRYQEKRHWVASSLFAADWITKDVALAAGVVANGEIDHAKMATLKLAALTRVAKLSKDRGQDQAAVSLLVELAAEGSAEAKARLAAIKADQSPRVKSSGFQLNIRRPMRDLEPDQALYYMRKLLPAVDEISLRLEGVDTIARQDLAARLTQIVERLQDQN